MDTEQPAEQSLAERLALLPVIELECADVFLAMSTQLLTNAGHVEARQFINGVRVLLDQERCRRRLNEEAEQAELERWAELP